MAQRLEVGAPSIFGNVRIVFIVNQCQFEFEDAFFADTLSICRESVVWRELGVCRLLARTHGGDRRYWRYGCVHTVDQPVLVVIIVGGTERVERHREVVVGGAARARRKGQRL